MHFVVSSFQSLSMQAVIAAVADDVQLIVSNNSVDSSQGGTCCAQQRGIDTAGIVRVIVADNMNDSGIPRVQQRSV
jgi:hypothetical protein